MSQTRALLRLAGLFVPILVWLLPALGSRALALVGARRAALRTAARVQAGWAGFSLWILGVRLEPVPALPRRGLLLVSNHLSWLDILVLARCMPCRFVAKSEIAGWPLLGQLARSVGTLFIARGRARDVLRVQRELADTLSSGVHALVFAEGRASDGSSVAPFHPALLELSERHGIECLAVGLVYATPGDARPLASTIAWRDATGFWQHAWRVLRLERIEAAARWSGPFAPRPRRELARVLHAEVLALRARPPAT